ncbi:hypothetical protein [Rhodococcus rhodnii]|uniref:hypothetical protein n=1 Tax=Rhodococcus rhodnii TaxID=38312 RepID=UPI000ACA6E84|nr:hypothetical protein [Rhodococcus rhodnii]
MTHVRSSDSGLFDGRDIVIATPGLYSSPQELAEVAYQHGYVFAWGQRHGQFSDITLYYFRNLFTNQ